MEIKKEQYQYIWYSLYRLLSESKDPKIIRYQTSSRLSAYFELNMEELNYEQIEKEVVIETNPFYRFTDIFSAIMNPDLQEGLEIRKELENIILHILGNLDLQEGLNKRIIMNRLIEQKIESGRYGESVKENFEILTRREKIIIADGLQDKYKCMKELEVFKKVFSKIYRDSIIYDSLEEQEQIVLYINEEKTKENKKKERLIEELFLPLGLNSRVFYKRHFGLMGVEETMKIGEMVIY